jgi:hypothetical protein
MQTNEMFLGLTATGWTVVGSIAGALSILVLTIYNYLYIRTAIRGIQMQIEGVDVQMKAMELQVDGILFSSCPVLTIRKDREGNDVIYNCGQGPALMVQWGYGQSIPETKILKRLDDNIIPAGDSQTIEVDWELARRSGLILTAYGVTNDRFVTKMAWPHGGIERVVDFGTCEQKGRGNLKLDT